MGSTMLVFGSVAFTYAACEAALESFRGEADWKNGAVAGFAAGMLLPCTFKDVIVFLYPGDPMLVSAWCWGCENYMAECDSARRVHHWYSYWKHWRCSHYRHDVCGRIHGCGCMQRSDTCKHFFSGPHTSQPICEQDRSTKVLRIIRVVFYRHQAHGKSGCGRFGE